MSKNKKIIIDDLSHGLYSYHIKNKNHRLSRVLRTFLLRNDFQQFLSYIKKTFIIKQTYTKNGQKQNTYYFMPDIVKSHEYIDTYISSIIKSEYFQNQNTEFQKDFIHVSPHFIIESFLYTYANEKNTNSLFNGTVLTGEDVFKSPAISHEHYQKKYFWDTFGEAFFDIPKKYDWSQKNPTEITMCAPPYTKNTSTKKPDPEKLCQLIIYEHAEKNEVIDYINDHWSTISDTSKANRPPRIEKRISADKTLLRDIDIYNKYQEFKFAENNKPNRGPDIRTYTWLKKESKYKIDIDPMTIRKIVSKLNNDNCEK